MIIKVIKNEVKLKEYRRTKYKIKRVWSIDYIVNNCEGGSITSNPRH